MKVIKRIGISLGILIFLLIVSFFGLVIFFNAIRTNDLSLQKDNINELKEFYSTNYQPIDESKFVDFDLNDDNIRLNEIQILASHNSYKKLGTKIGKLFIGLGDSFEQADLLKYNNNSLTEQFNNGIRSIELDLRYRAGDFEVVHVPLVDNSSNATNFALALEEIKLWSDNSPNHIPLMVLLELKNDWMMLDSKLSDFSELELLKLDILLKNTFTTKLLTPKDVIGSQNTLKEAILTNGWPLLKDTLGKVIFILHPGNYTDTYVQMDPNFSKMAMFPSATNNDIDNTYASFIVHNNPDVESINNLVSKNFIVRTRVDSLLVPDQVKLIDGLNSGAQILSSDFPPNHNLKYDFVAYLNEEYTVIKNRYNNLN